MSSTISVTDMFCGAGGSSIGIRDAGADLRLGMNHWKLAIETHSANFPDADHALCDVSLADPRWYPRTTVLVAAPQCTNHSVAKGVRRKHGQRTMFETVLDDPAADRSRATAWDVVRFTEHHRYEIVIVENVTDFRKWELWDAWWQAMLLLGYAGQVVYLNSMFCHPTPQSRDRMYVCFWKRGNRVPDLDIRPEAWCPRCGCNVQSVQSWKKPNKVRAGRYRQQYVYRCPACANVVAPYSSCAANAIDWALPAPRIGDRARPLTARTLQRIQKGLERFGRQGQHARPPFLVSYYSGGGQSSGIGEPLPTQDTRDRHGLVIPPGFVLSYSNRANDLAAAVHLVAPGDAADTELPAVADCGFRMLQPHEIAAAMAFPAGYVVLGTQREKIKQYGNAVTPPVMTALFKRCVETLG